MELLLNSKIIESDKKEKIKNAIILLHGYGGDGADISSVAYSWKRFIDNTVFLCPDGHEACKLNPNGFQWFDLSVDDNNYIISEVKKAEKIYGELKKQNIDVLLDDVDENMSNKFKKHDLIGTPYQIIIGSKSDRKKILKN